ncbi:outer membrane beta-barrel protein [Mucilaginibacter jinjuensis]|uniref:Outer membrane protein beta-barrel domain-containing protein n=1 Tax=Mucilaginibacter jinjuensis TaxID=1176721 RepID=A0ABY7T0U1_9SPHI|nr:outer membrane beta-barrel protein [Mucilaginibacter jinjuensis]WCT10055.1 hypothetical protein PQO05_15080 [Mucilaginibacter jinjuensis]
MTIKQLSRVAFAVIAFACLSISQHAEAQAKDSENTWRLGIGVEPGLPVGNDIRYVSRFSLGGSLRLQYDVKGPVSLMLTSGYTNFFGREFTQSIAIGGGKTVYNNVKFDNYGIIPVKIGAKIFAGQNLYVSAEGGAGFETTGSDKNVKMILSPGIGYATNFGLDFGARYDYYSGQNDNFGQVALRIAYGFKL